MRLGLAGVHWNRRERSHGGGRCGAPSGSRKVLTRASRRGCAVRRLACSHRGRCCSRSPRAPACSRCSTIVTILARRLSVAELGAYGLVASLAGYLLVLRNSVASSAVRAMAGAVDRAERAAASSRPRRRSTRWRAWRPALLIAGAGAADRGADPRRRRWPSDARVGGLGLGALTAVGVAASVWLDALRAERQFVRAARHRDRRGGALPRHDARADLRRRGPRRADRGERRAAALQRHAVGRWWPRGAGLGLRLRPSARHAAARDGDRADRGLAARGRAVQPGDVRVQPGDPGRLPHPARGRPVRGAGARAQPALRARRGAGGAGGADRARATWRPATSAACASWPCAARATRWRCSCRSA